MVAEPNVFPLMRPVPAATITVVSVLLHIPPELASDNVVVRPEQIFLFPVIGAGNGATVTCLVAMQPVASVKLIVAVPGDTPVTMPEPVPIATVRSALFQLPPGVVSLNCVGTLTQTVAFPVIAAGTGFTVVIFVVIHPVGSV